MSEDEAKEATTHNRPQLQRHGSEDDDLMEPRETSEQHAKQATTLQLEQGLERARRYLAENPGTETVEQHIEIIEAELACRQAKYLEWLERQGMPDGN